MANFQKQSKENATWKTPTLYEILGVPKNATNKEIKVAYYKKCKEHHPDTNKGQNQSHDKFIKIQKAYDTLSQANSRRDYDLSLQNYGPGNGNRHTRSNPTDVYQAYQNHQQTYYHYYGHRPGMGHSESEFDKFMRSRQAYFYSQKKASTPPSNNEDFSSPLKVMIYLILGIGLFEAITVSWIYDRDINYLHEHTYKYSPLNRQAMANLRHEVNNLDLTELEDKIREVKELEERVK